MPRERAMTAVTNPPARRRFSWPRLRYNPVKGLSGQTLADIVNFLAVVVGLGAAPQLSGAYAWFWASGLVIGLLTLGVAGFQFYRAKREAAPGTWYMLAVFTTIVGLFTIASNLTVIIMTAMNPLETGVTAGIVGYPAFAAWIIAEAWNFYDNATKRPKTGPSNLSLFKSLCQVIGALIIWIFVILTLRYEVVRLLSGLFWTGAAIALLGTLLGIAAGIWNLRRK
ncbi:MAG: hypothetical protein IPH82_23065 [Chloroflexi bacterium]|nr:hypothetical protein [Chloroflexota bacterium]